MKIIIMLRTWECEIVIMSKCENREHDYNFWKLWTCRKTKDVKISWCERGHFCGNVRKWECEKHEHNQNAKNVEHVAMREGQNVRMSKCENIIMWTCENATMWQWWTLCVKIMRIMRMWKSEAWGCEHVTNNENNGNDENYESDGNNKNDEDATM